MNVFIIVVCVNLITLANAAHDINLVKILKILKQKPRKSGYSNIEESNESIEAIPIIPGFYLQKPKGLSKSLFENPKAWPDDLVGILGSDDPKTRQNKTRISAKAVNKSPREDYLTNKILKAVKNLKKYREIQKYKNDILKKSKAKKEPVKKLLGRIFQGIKGGIDYQGKGKYKKSRNQNSSSKNNKILGKLLKNLLHGSINAQKYRGRENYGYRYDEIEEKKQNTGDLLGSFVNAIKYTDQGQGSEIYQRPSMVIISSKSLHGDENENENNAKESMEVSEEDHDGSDSFNLYNTRRTGKPDIGSKDFSETTVESGSSDYERNPGNPFTIHKNKYKQNWPYNHYMDGDHMNINPFGPQFGNLGPTGPELFFGRKWWYFNQDDFKPMG